MPQTHASRPDADRIAALLDREDALVERARQLQPKQRGEVEHELGQIRLMLELLGYRRSK